MIRNSMDHGLETPEDRIAAGTGSNVTTTLFDGTTTVTVATNTAKGNNSGTDTLSNIENVNGSASSDVIVGSSAANRLAGGDGADTVDGGSGNDTVMGGAGTDSVLGGDGNDVVDGGTGDDTLLGGAGLDTLLGGAGSDSVLGDAGNDSLAGGDGNDTLDGGAGADHLVGGVGNDIYMVDNSGDVVAELGGEAGRSFALTRMYGGPVVGREQALSRRKVVIRQRVVRHREPPGKPAPSLRRGGPGRP